MVSCEAIAESPPVKLITIGSGMPVDSNVLTGCALNEPVTVELTNANALFAAQQFVI